MKKVIFKRTEQVKAQWRCGAALSLGRSLSHIRAHLSCQSQGFLLLRDCFQFPFYPTTPYFTRIANKRNPPYSSFCSYLWPRLVRDRKHLHPMVLFLKKNKINRSMPLVPPVAGGGIKRGRGRNDERFMAGHWGQAVFFYQPLINQIRTLVIFPSQSVLHSLCSASPLPPFPDQCLQEDHSPSLPSLPHSSSFYISLFRPHSFFTPTPPPGFFFVSSLSFLAFLVYFGLSRQVSPSQPAAAPEQMAAHSTSC